MFIYTSSNRFGEYASMDITCTHPRDLQAGSWHIACDTLQSRFHHKGLNGPCIMAERYY